MFKITITATFMGGAFGFTEFKLRRNGLLYTSFVIRGSGSKEIDLEEGLYLVSAHGVAPPDGAEITISENTTPLTPDQFPEGPIFSSYVLNLH